MFAKLKQAMIWVAENEYGGMPQNCEQLCAAIKKFSVVGIPGLEAEDACKNCNLFCKVMDAVKSMMEAMTAEETGSALKFSE